jgi:hypothetical protein
VKSRLAMATCAALWMSVASIASAQPRWGSSGHEHITAGAINHLPQPLRGFFQANSDTVSNAAGVEPPGTHYIDIDVYPEFFAGTFPRDWDAAVALYGVSTLNANGIGPWNAETYAANLSTLMANAHTQQDWLNLLQTAGALAHYVEDLHNPLHLTENYNGQLTGNDGIHSRYESNMISRHLPDGLPIVATPSHCVYYASFIDAVFDEIDVNYWYVDDIMAADDTAVALDPRYRTTYYNSLWADTGAFTQVLFQEASEMVASAWYTAWVNAGSPMPIPAPVSLGDLNCDGVVNVSDIDPFVLALIDPAEYARQYPSCAIILADVNSDAQRDGRDIQAFVSKLLTP